MDNMPLAEAVERLEGMHEACRRVARNGKDCAREAGLNAAALRVVLDALARRSRLEAWEDTVKTGGNG